MNKRKDARNPPLFSKVLLRLQRSYSPSLFPKSSNKKPAPNAFGSFLFANAVKNKPGETYISAKKILKKKAAQKSCAATQLSDQKRNMSKLKRLFE